VGTIFLFVRYTKENTRECSSHAPLDPLDIYGYAKIPKTPVNQIAGYISGNIF